MTDIEFINAVKTLIHDYATWIWIIIFAFLLKGK